MDLLDGVLLLDCQPLHQPDVLRWGDGKDFLLIARPLEPSGFQPFVQEKESVLFPQKSFDPVSPAPTEEEQYPREKRIKPELALHQGGKAINASAEICVAAGDIYFLETAGVIEHGTSPGPSVPAVWARWCFGSQQSRKGSAGPQPVSPDLLWPVKVMTEVWERVQRPALRHF